VTKSTRIGLAKVALWLAALGPLGSLVWDGFHGTLGSDPVETITHTTGLTGLILLFVTLAVTPLRRLTGLNALIRFRRLLGLFAFFYVCLHLLTYIVFEHFFSVPEMVDDVIEHPYVTVGFLAFLLLIPLAVTSTTGWVRRLGGKRWARLHQLIYVSAALGVLHFLWLVKLDTREPVIYGLVLVVLLAARLGQGRRKRQPTSRAPRTSPMARDRDAGAGAERRLDRPEPA